jgi:hypothetical protein
MAGNMLKIGNAILANDGKAQTLFTVNTGVLSPVKHLI